MWLPKKYFSCDISSTGEIKHLSQIGKVLVFAPSRRHYLSSLDNNVISQTELLEFMLCTCDFSVWNITLAPSLPHLLSTCSSPGKTHPSSLSPSRASSFVMPFWLPQVTWARLLGSTYSQGLPPTYPPPTFTTLLYTRFHFILHWLSASLMILALCIENQSKINGRKKSLDAEIWATNYSNQKGSKMWSSG